MNFSAVVPDERSRRELNDMLTKILDDVAPGETSMLLRVEASIADSAPAATKSTLVTNRVRRRGFPGVIETGLVCLHLLAGTLALVDAYVRRKERQEQREFEYTIKEEWEKALIHAGMSPELAREIPVKFSADMIRFIITQRLPQPDDRQDLR